MNQKDNLLSRENMTQEEFVILCASLPKNNRSILVNPIDSLDARILKTKLKNRSDFFEFCINNFLKMHHPISQAFLLSEINQKCFHLDEISFDLYDLLVEKFFYECRTKLTDTNIQTIFQIQVKIFLFLYDQDFWKQIFVYEDCCTYIFQYPENQIFGFISNLFNEIQKNRSDKIMNQMYNDGLINIISKYLLEKTHQNVNGAIDSLCKLISTLNFGYVLKFPFCEEFLKGLLENPARSIKFLNAMFSNQQLKGILPIDKKAEIVKFIEENHFFEYFSEYLSIEMSDDKQGLKTVSQFSALLFGIFNPLVQPNVQDRETLLPTLEKFLPVFFNTLSCLEELPNDFSNFLFNLAFFIPSCQEALMSTLIRRINFIISTIESSYRAGEILPNYMNLFLKIQNEINSEVDVFIQLFQTLEVDTKNLNRSLSFLSVLIEIIDLDDFHTSDYFSYENKDEENGDEESQMQIYRKVPHHSYTQSTVKLLEATVTYFNFIFDEGFCEYEDDQSEVRLQLFEMYSRIMFEFIQTNDAKRHEREIINIFTTGLKHVNQFSHLIDFCVSEYPTIIQKVEGIDSIILNLLSSFNLDLEEAGLKMVDFLVSKTNVISRVKRDEIIFEAIRRVIHSYNQVGLEMTQAAKFKLVMPLFLSTSVESANRNRAAENGENISPEVVSSIHDFFLQFRDEIPSKDGVEPNDWLISFLHFFGFIFIGDVSPFYDQILAKPPPVESEELLNFDFEKVKILASELSSFVQFVVPAKNPAEEEKDKISEQLDFVLRVLLASCDQCVNLINEFMLDEGESFFGANNGLQFTGYYSIKENVIEAIDFANAASKFFVNLLNQMKLPEVLKAVLPLFRMCCELPIIKKKSLLRSIFDLVLKVDFDLAIEFLNGTMRLLYFVQLNESYKSLLVPIAIFHRAIIKVDPKRFFEITNSRISDAYKNFLFDPSIDPDVQLFENNLKRIFYPKNFRH